MRRSLIILATSFALVFGLVNLDLQFPQDGGTSVVNLGPDDAQARRGSGFSRPRVSRPRTQRPSPKATKPAAKPAPKPTAPASKPVAKPTRTKDSAVQAARRQQSQRKALAAKPSITSSSGRPIRVAGTPAAASVRKMSPAQYANRDARKNTYYRSIPTRERTVIINRYGGGYYGDPFSGLFMYSLLSMSLHEQAMFHHHHWGSYSTMRQQELLAKNAALEVELARLQGQARDPNYVPAGADPDLIYSDEFVQAAYNPEPVKESHTGAWVVVLLLLAALGVGTYLVFFRRTRPEYEAY